MKLAAMCSGGKDSAFAAYQASRDGHTLACLITLIPESPESYMFHYPNSDKTSLHASAMGIPLLKGETLGVKEDELNDLRGLLSVAAQRYGIDGIVTGGLASEYQKARFEKVCNDIGIECLSPLWGKDQEQHLRDLLEHGFEIIFTGVSAAGFGPEWLGRRLDLNAINELINLHHRYSINIALEGGEGETFALASPLFQRKRIELLHAEKVWLGDRGYLKILQAQLVDA